MRRPALVNVVILALVPVVGCAAASIANRPTDYGRELAGCEAKAGDAGWSAFTPCCVDVATRYGRDPLFCFPDDQ